MDQAVRGRLLGNKIFISHVSFFVCLKYFQVRIMLFSRRIFSSSVVYFTGNHTFRGKSLPMLNDVIYEVAKKVWSLPS